MPFDGRNYEQQDAVLELLRKARERVAMPDGWCQGELSIGRSACSVGWLCLLGNETNPKNTGPAVNILFNALPDEWRATDITGHEWWKTVVQYNDAPGRTQAEIVALFDAAIARREKEGGTTG